MELLKTRVGPVSPEDGIAMIRKKILGSPQPALLQ
jgi:hypothetical protein